MDGKEVARLFRAIHGELCPIPRLLTGRCTLCRGPVQPVYSRCYPCNGFVSAIPRQLRDRVFPMTAAVNPSPWYGHLWRYKNGQPESRPVLSAVAFSWLDAQWVHLTESLGGAPTLMTLVPSTRPNVTYKDQPLRLALSAMPTLPATLAQTLRHDAKTALARGEYKPDAFVPHGADVVGERVILIEDSWATGGRVLSAAGALLDAGATAVAITPIARIVDREFWITPHPNLLYVQAIRAAYDLAKWPF